MQFLLLALLLLSVSAVERYNKTAPGYEIYCYGNCARDVTSGFVGGIGMMGGGPDVDAAFSWLVDNAGGGDIVVLRTSGTDAYNEYIYDLGDCNSVTTIIITSRVGAQAGEVVDWVEDAEAIFVAGGDQSTYMSYWADTPLSDAIQYRIDQGVTFAGTSAGFHIQGEYVYTGEKGSATSETSLNFPYNPLITISSSFLYLPWLGDLITDSHFYERDRMGRTITFLARLIEDGDTSAGVAAIAIDEETALLVDRRGRGTPVGRGTVYILETLRAPEVCEPGRSLTMSRVLVNAISAANRGVFDLDAWVVTGGREYEIDADQGRLYSTQAGGAIY